MKNIFNKLFGNKNAKKTLTHEASNLDRDLSFHTSTFPKESALFMAIRNAAPAQVKKRLEGGANPNQKLSVMRKHDNYDSYPLYEAIYTVLNNEVSTSSDGSFSLLENNIDLEKMMEVIDLLLSYGADIKMISLNTVLSLGDADKKYELIKYLISKNASIYSYSWGGSFVSEFIKKFNRKPDFFNYLESLNIDYERVLDNEVRISHEIIENFNSKHHLDLLSYFAKKIDLNTKNQKGETPLIIALKNQYSSSLEAVKILVEHGANTKLKDNSNKPASYWATFGAKNKEIADYLDSIK